MSPRERRPPLLMVHFAALVDPRVERTKRHSMTDILVLSLCGFVCGIDNWVDLEELGEIREDWFRTFLELPNGIPSHDTFGRFFAALAPESFSRCFSTWMQAVSEVKDGEVVAIDGKTLRRSFDRASSKAAIHMVSAWATGSGVVLGQVKTDEKSNEITAATGGGAGGLLAPCWDVGARKRPPRPRAARSVRRAGASGRVEIEASRGRPLRIHAQGRREATVGADGGGADEAACGLAAPPRGST